MVVVWVTNLGMEGVRMGMGKTGKRAARGLWILLERERLHVKQLIDHALNTLKVHSHLDPYSVDN
jgi:hypothetical protein